MLKFKDGIKIYVSIKPIDFRKSIDSLAALVSDEFAGNPLSGNVYVFINKARDKVKCLIWDRNGFVLYYKRLEKLRFKLPDVKQLQVEIDLKQLRWLLAGLDYLLIEEYADLEYCSYY